MKLFAEGIHERLRQVFHEFDEYCKQNGVFYIIVSDEHDLQGYLIRKESKDKVADLVEALRPVVERNNVHAEVKDRKDGTLITLTLGAISDDGHWDVMSGHPGQMQGQSTKKDKHQFTLFADPRSAKKVRRGRALGQSRFDEELDKILEGVRHHPCGHNTTFDSEKEGRDCIYANEPCPKCKKMKTEDYHCGQWWTWNEAGGMDKEGNIETDNILDLYAMLIEMAKKSNFAADVISEVGGKTHQPTRVLGKNGRVLIPSPFGDFKELMRTDEGYTWKEVEGEPVEEDQYKVPTRKMIRKQSSFPSSFGPSKSFGGIKKYNGIKEYQVDWVLSINEAIGPRDPYKKATIRWFKDFKCRECGHWVDFNELRFPQVAYDTAVRRGAAICKHCSDKIMRLMPDRPTPDDYRRAGIVKKESAKPDLLPPNMRPLGVFGPSDPKGRSSSSFSRQGQESMDRNNSISEGAAEDGIYSLIQRIAIGSGMATQARKIQKGLEFFAKACDGKLKVEAHQTPDLRYATVEVTYNGKVIHEGEIDFYGSPDRNEQEILDIIEVVKSKFLNEGYSRDEWNALKNYRKCLSEDIKTDARRNLQLAGLFSKDSDYDGMLGRAVMDLVEAHTGQGHSGFSSNIALQVFNKVIRGEALTKRYWEEKAKELKNLYMEHCGEPIPGFSPNDFIEQCIGKCPAT